MFSITKYDGVIVIYVIVIEEKFLKNMLISNRNFCKDVRDLYEYFLLKMNCAE